MKGILVIYNAAVEEAVWEALADAGVEHYTKFEQILGHGEGSGPRLGDHIWPGHNNCLFIAAEGEKAAALTEGIKRARRRVAGEGLRAFWWEIEGSI